MKSLLKISAAALLGSAVSASATSLIDFTEEPLALSGNIGSTTFVVTGFPNPAQAPGVGPAPGMPTFNGGAGQDLAGDNDGLGVAGPEVSGGKPFITVTFSEKVKLVGTYFLNLFEDDGTKDNDESEEIVEIIVDLDPLDTDPFDDTVDHTVDAVEEFENNFGFAFDDTATLVGESFTFFIRSENNDDVGRADFSLAALEVQAIPLPAGALLMGTALGGLGLMRRRKKA